MLFEAGDFVVQLLLAAAEQRFLALRLAGSLGTQLFADGQLAALHLGAQALDAQGHGDAVGIGFADVGLEARGIQAQQRVADFDHLAFVDEHLGDDAAFEVGDLLQLGRGDRLAIATGDFVDLGEMRPEAEEQGEADQRPDGQAHHAGGVLDQCLADFRQGLAGEVFAAFEIAQQRLAQRLTRH